MINLNMHIRFGYVTCMSSMNLMPIMYTVTNTTKTHIQRGDPKFEHTKSRT